MSSRDPIVSSAHLMSERGGELSQFEYALIIASHAFQRWMVHCAAAAGVPDLSPLDVLVLHHVNHRGREKTLAGICLLLNIEDTHLVNYALKKLRRLELVEGGRRGKEAAYSITDAGRQVCERYGAIRETCLVEALEALGGARSEDLQRIATQLRALSGLYDQAARSATSL